MCLPNTLKIGGILASSFPALLAASIGAVEFDPNLLFDAARVFSPDSADTDKTYIRISGTRNVAYSHAFLFEGHHHIPTAPMKQLCAVTVEGRMECGYRLHGEFFQSDGSIDADRSVLHMCSETETLSVGDLRSCEGQGPLPALYKIRGVRFMKNTDICGIDALVSTPKAELRTEYLPGNCTQGPYALSHVPVAAGTEKITLIDGLIEISIQPSSYRMNYSTGSFTFKDHLIHSGQLIKITYQQVGSEHPSSIRRIKITHHPFDSLSATAQILTISDEEGKRYDKYATLGLDSRSRHGEVSGMVTLKHDKVRPCGAAASELRLQRSAGRFGLDVKYSHMGRALAKLRGLGFRQQEIEADASLLLPLQSRLRVTYLGKMNEQSRGRLTTCEFSIPLPYSSTLTCERINEDYSNASGSKNRFAISRETTSHKLILSLYSGRSNGVRTSGCSSHVEISPLQSIQATLSSCYSAMAGLPAHTAFHYQMQGALHDLASTALSIRLDRSAGDRLRRVVCAEASTKRNAPITLACEYNLKCLSPEAKESQGYREVHHLTGSAKLKLAGLTLTYSPRLSRSHHPELMQHRFVSCWALSKQFALQASMDKASFNPPDNRNIAYENEAFKAACRISPSRSFRGDLSHSSSRRSNPSIPSFCIERKSQARVVTLIGDGGSLELGFSALSSTQDKADSCASSFRDRTIDANVTRELSPGFLAYIELAFTERDASSRGNSRSPGVGLRMNTGGGTTAEISYKRVMWEGLPVRDSENLTLQVNSAETWLSSNCTIEYIALTRPISKILVLSVDGSLHF